MIFVSLICVGVGSEDILTYNIDSNLAERRKERFEAKNRDTASVELFIVHLV